MIDTKDVMGKHPGSGRPRHEPGNPVGGPPRGMRALAAVCGGLFGGHARSDASVAATFSGPARPGVSKAYQVAA